MNIKNYLKLIKQLKMETILGKDISIKISNVKLTSMMFVI